MTRIIALTLSLVVACGDTDTGTTTDTADTGFVPHWDLIEDDVVVDITEDPQIAIPCPDRDCL